MESFMKTLTQLLSNDVTRDGGAVRYAFAAFVHHEFEAASSSSQWLLHRLVPKAIGATSVSSLALPKRRTQVNFVRDLSGCHPLRASSTAIYYRPENDSAWPSFDGLYQIGGEAWLIQVTLTADHPLKAAAFKFCYEQLTTNKFAPSSIRIILVTDGRSTLHQRQQWDTNVFESAQEHRPVNAAHHVRTLQHERRDCKTLLDRVEQYRLVMRPFERDEINV